MSHRSKVVWSEGLFLRPQHFQQQDRYLHQFVESRVGPLQPYAWGVHEIEVDRALPKSSPVRKHPAYVTLSRHRRVDKLTIVRTDDAKALGRPADFSREAIERRHPGLDGVSERRGDVRGRGRGADGGVSLFGRMGRLRQRRGSRHPADGS